MVHRLAFAGGGTGGHVMPIAALIEHAVDHSDVCPKCKWYWLGSPSSLECDVARRYEGVRFLPLLSGKWRSYGGWREQLLNLRDAILLMIGVLQAIYYLLVYRIDCVFCKGGYVSLPAIIAARLLRRRIVVHESDSVPGKTNRLAMRWSADVLCGLPLSDVSTVSRHVGQLLSPSLGFPISCAGLPKSDTKKTTLLVLLGSQGSQVVLLILLTLFDTHATLMQQYERIILTGRLNSQYTQRFAAHDVEAHTFVDHDVLRGLYARADWCLSRGSATAIAEQKLFDIRHLIVPLPHAGGNHQYHNARYFVDTYDDVLIVQDDQLAGVIVEHLSTPLEKITKSTTLIQRQHLLSAPLRDTRSVICATDTD